MRARQTNRRPESADVTWISPEELASLISRGERLLVLDTRQPGAYAEFPGAIPGSVRVPPSEIPERYSELPRDRTIVVYCT